MLSYNDLFEILRKEKYSENLQPLPKNFVEEFKQFIQDQRDLAKKDSDLFTGQIEKTKKQLENSIAIFKEIILKRKRKILDLIFIATETGIMKRDYENMLAHEKKVFDKMTKVFDQGDKELSNLLNGKKLELKNKMIIFEIDVDEFIDHEGNYLGPYRKGDLVNLDLEIASIFVNEKKANFVDQDL